MVDDFGKKLLHKTERNLRKVGLKMAGCNCWVKFVHVYDQCTRLLAYTVAALDETFRFKVIDKKKQF